MRRQTHKRNTRKPWNAEKALDVGVVLADYIAARAGVEGVGSDLGADWFAAHLMAGYRLFFGVTVAENGTLVGDSQEPKPGYLTSWLAAHAAAAEKQ